LTASWVACGTSPIEGAPSGAKLVDRTVTITMDPFVVPPAGEIYKCQNFASPFESEVAISAFESHMTAGSHHMLLFYKDGATNQPIEDCSGLEFAATPYGSQQRDDDLAFP